MQYIPVGVLPKNYKFGLGRAGDRQFTSEKVIYDFRKYHTNSKTPEKEIIFTGQSMPTASNCPSPKQDLYHLCNRQPE